MGLNMRSKIIRNSYFIFAFAVLIQIAISFIWIFQNITAVPQYGDTSEYLNLSKTLELDKFRTILFPLLLKWVIFASSHLNFPYPIALYIIQMAVSFISLVYLFNIMFKCCKGFAKNQSIVLFSSLFVFSNPLIAHFNLSVLSDSLALSFTVFFLASLINFWTSKKISPLNLFLVFGFYVLMSLTRPERKLLGIALIILIILFELLKNRKIKSYRIIKKSICVFLTAITAFAIIGVANNLTQSAAPNREQPTLYKSAFEFTVGSRIAKVYPYLPSSIKNVISYKDAVTSNTVVYNKILNHDKGNPSKIFKIAEIAFLKFYPEITGGFLLNVCKNIVSPFCYAFNFLLNDGNINWTRTRMSMAHPRLTTIYDIYSKLLFLIIAITAIFGLIRKKIVRCLQKSSIQISVIFILLFSIFFTAVSDIGFHIRYALPVFTVLVVLTSLFAALTVLPLKNNKDCK